MDAARRAGLVLPSLCEQGWCTTCAAKILEGEVDQTDSLRYYSQDRAAGFALLCTGKPRSNLRLQTHAAAEMRRFRRRMGLPAPRAVGI
ncbi:MAG: 2Fe-2S iron-sulfur cluster-binding protein [Candidatus Methylomirabilaceae bacterium]